MRAQPLNHVWLFVTPWTVTCQAPLSMQFSRQEFRSGLPCPPPGDLLDPGVEPMCPLSPALQADSCGWATGSPFIVQVTSVIISREMIEWVDEHITIEYNVSIEENENYIHSPGGIFIPPALLSEKSNNKETNLVWIHFCKRKNTKRKILTYTYKHLYVFIWLWIKTCL